MKKKFLGLVLAVILVMLMVIPSVSANTIISTTTIEAESATLSGGAVVANYHIGYSGTGFVEGYWNVGATTTFSYTAAVGMYYELWMLYSNGTGSTKTLDLYVDGVLSTTRSFIASTDWDTWVWNTDGAGTGIFPKVYLTAGSHTIAYKYNSSNTANINLDKLEIRPANTVYMEMETGTLVNGALHNDRLNYTGTSYVALNGTGGSVTLNDVYQNANNWRTSTIRYANGNGNARTLSVYVNGTLTTAHLNFPATTDWNTWSTVTVTLPLIAGTNTVAYVWTSTDSGGINLDNLSIGGLTSVSP